MVAQKSSAFLRTLVLCAKSYCSSKFVHDTQLPYSQVVNQFKAGTY